ncbi:hypothetical protein E2C01_059120 [Portunus trituberculatus]|uniref:Uncharacterized protein n=1 Tax=Portunus trituberculatus TaxID=210409 RepID=A0A5B7H6P7_PORTR|nr:hypothetical protein [Portunus trituberculatus]
MAYPRSPGHPSPVNPTTPQVILPRLGITSRPHRQHAWTQQRAAHLKHCVSGHDGKNKGSFFTCPLKRRGKREHNVRAVRRRINSARVAAAGGGDGAGHCTLKESYFKLVLPQIIEPRLSHGVRGLDKGVTAVSAKRDLHADKIYITREPEATLCLLATPGMQAGAHRPEKQREG